MSDLGIEWYDAIMYASMGSFVILAIALLVAGFFVKSQYESRKSKEWEDHAAAEVARENERVQAIRDTAARSERKRRADEQNINLGPDPLALIEEWPTPAPYTVPTDDQIQQIVSLAATNGASVPRYNDQIQQPPLARPPLMGSAKFVYVATRDIYSFLKISVSARGVLSGATTFEGGRPKRPSLTAAVFSAGVRQSVTVTPLLILDQEQIGTGGTRAVNVSGVIALSSSTSPLMKSGDVVMLIGVDFKNLQLASFQIFVGVKDYAPEDPSKLMYDATDAVQNDALEIA